MNTPLLSGHRLPQIAEARQSLRDILQQLSGQRGSIEEDIHSAFAELHKTLDVRKSVLLMELEVTYTLKQKVPGPHILLCSHCFAKVFSEGSVC